MIYGYGMLLCVWEGVRKLLLLLRVWGVEEVMDEKNWLFDWE